MCGRYARYTPAEIYARLFDTESCPDIEARYNVAPAQQVLAARNAAGGGRELVMLRWGLIPFWARERNLGYSTINARAETVATRPAYRSALRLRRCLIAADGFYEWRTLGKGKQPYFIRMKGGEPFAFAGLWERWEGEGDVIESCAIIVTAANDVVAPIHDRMPVILVPGDYDRWLDPGQKDPAQLQPLLGPYPARAMEAYPVSRQVNNPRQDRPELMAPAADVAGV
jgi:putative SOS response-associated peptidase YedK